MLERSGFYEQIAPETLFLSVHDAVVTAGKLDLEASDTYPGCPKADLGKSVAMAVYDSDAVVQETTSTGPRTWHVGARAPSNAGQITQDVTPSRTISPSTSGDASTDSGARQ